MNTAPVAVILHRSVIDPVCLIDNAIHALPLVFHSAGYAPVGSCAEYDDLVVRAVVVVCMKALPVPFFQVDDQLAMNHKFRRLDEIDLEGTAGVGKPRRRCGEGRSAFSRMSGPTARSAVWT